MRLNCSNASRKEKNLYPFRGGPVKHGEKPKSATYFSRWCFFLALRPRLASEISLLLFCRHVESYGGQYPDLLAAISRIRKFDLPLERTNDA